MCRWMGLHFHDWSDYNGVHFQQSYQNGVANFRIFGVSRDLKWEDSRLKKIRNLLFIKFNNELALTALHSVLETTLIR